MSSKNKRLLFVGLTALIMCLIGIFGYYKLGRLDEDIAPLASVAEESQESSESEEIINLDEESQSENFTVENNSQDGSLQDDSNIEIIWENGKPKKAESNDDAPEGWVSLEDKSSKNSSKDKKNVENSHNAKDTKALDTVSKKGSSSSGVSKSSPEKKSQSDSKEESDKKKLSEMPEVDYAYLLKHPDALGFTPDKDLFRDIYFEIRSSYVEPVTDEQLYVGVLKEVGSLLTAAGVPKNGLHSLDKKRNILTQLLELYENKVDTRLLLFSAIRGMLVGLGDPYSILMTPKEYGQLQESVQTKGFGGLGIYIESDKEAGNQITIVEPIEGTPAYKAGLEPGDQILAIDGKSTKGMALDVATTKLRGKVGSTVNLKIRRHGSANPLNIAIVRADIHVISCVSKMVGGNIGYIRLRQFGSLTSSELEKEISKIKSHGAQACILDLRNNGGGYVDAAIGVCGQFLSRNSLVVFTKDRRGTREDLKSKIDGGLNMPIVVLINRFSASASEITAGCLRDHKLAKLVGEKSFGKGSVQQLFPFSDKSALKLTIARFYSPAGHVIDHKGLEPDYSVKMEPRLVGKEGKDTQLQKAIDLLHTVR